MKLFITISCLFILSCNTPKQTIISLDGRKSYDPDGGKIVAYEWRQIAGDEAKIYSPYSVITPVNIPTIGIYIFELWGKNDKGLSARDTTIVRAKLSSVYITKLTIK